jgi:ribonuclease VapC
LIVDSSAILAILQLESEALSFATAITRASERYISAVSVLEAGIVVVKRRGARGARDVDELIATTALQVVPFDSQQASIAVAAFEHYGKGRHPAGLNFGDCAAYALAKSLGQPLLFKGRDFMQTDINPAT